DLPAAVQSPPLRWQGPPRPHRDRYAQALDERRRSQTLVRETPWKLDSYMPDDPELPFYRA
ncbi:hypothetical protein N7563_23040, partial [Leclercia adecarboxylata ATCC 23216 = NBRC 102595]|nr:hypothetical protein [Leclercia adecarboxylata ATCC 23216 = NBRC 102595]